MAGPAHTRATRAIQQRLERWELDHLRQLAAAQAEQIEQLQDQITALQREIECANDVAESWREAHHSLAEHLDNDTADARCIGMTVSGELLVIDAGAMQ